jgi:hypothetical protein
VARVMWFVEDTGKYLIRYWDDGVTERANLAKDAHLNRLQWALEV